MISEETLKNIELASQGLKGFDIFMKQILVDAAYDGPNARKESLQKFVTMVSPSSERDTQILFFERILHYLELVFKYCEFEI